MAQDPILQEYLDLIQRGLDNAAKHATRVTFHKHFDGTPHKRSLALSLYVQGGRTYVLTRGKARRSPIPGEVMYDRVSEEVTLEHCARMLIELGVQPHQVRINPSVTFVDETVV